jgi:hypothetical protein
MYSVLLLACTLVAPIQDDRIWSVDTAKLTPGLEAILGNSGYKLDPTQWVAVGVDVFAYRDWVKCETAGDREGMQELATRKRVHIVKLGSGVKLIEYRKDGLADVRITSGDQKGKRGLIAARFICERN